MQVVMRHCFHRTFRLEKGRIVRSFRGQQQQQQQQQPRHRLLQQHSILQEKGTGTRQIHLVLLLL